jgi:hypothetical protein
MKLLKGGTTSMVLFWGVFITTLVGIIVFHPGLPRPVKAGEIQRYEHISTSEWIDGYRFTVFHDKVSGQEVSCAENDMHFNPTCFPTGRNWK